MEKRKFLDESRQLKRLNALTRRQSHIYKWFAIVAALDCLLVSFYDQDMRNILFSGGEYLSLPARPGQGAPVSPGVG